MTQWKITKQIVGMLIRVPFGVAPISDMFQRKIDEWFHESPNVFGIADDILITGFKELCRDYDETVNKVLKILWKASLKLNNNKCHFRCTSIVFFGEIISRDGISPDPRKLKALMDMSPPRCKKELQSFLCMINYLSKFSQQLQKCINLG